MHFFSVCFHLFLNSEDKRKWYDFNIIVSFWLYDCGMIVARQSSPSSSVSPLSTLCWFGHTAFKTSTWHNFPILSTHAHLQFSYHSQSHPTTSCTVFPQHWFPRPFLHLSQYSLVLPTQRLCFLFHNHSLSHHLTSIHSSV